MGISNISKNESIDPLRAVLCRPISGIAPCCPSREASHPGPMLRSFWPMRSIRTHHDVAPNSAPFRTSSNTNDTNARPLERKRSRCTGRDLLTSGRSAVGVAWHGENTCLIMFVKTDACFSGFSINGLLLITSKQFSKSIHPSQAYEEWNTRAILLEAKPRAVLMKACAAPLTCDTSSTNNPSTD